MLNNEKDYGYAPRRFYEGEGAGAGDGGGAGGEGAGAGGAAAGGAGGAGGAAAGAAPVTFKLEHLPEDLRGNETLAKFQAKDGSFNVEQLSRSHLSLSKMMGNKDPSKYVEFPGADDAAGKRALLERLGAPKTVDGYKIEVPDGTSEGLKPQGDIAKGFTATAHKLGLLPEQVQGIYGWFAGLGTQTLQQQKAETEKTVDGWVAGLEQEFGDAFDEKVAAANYAVDKTGGDELRKALKDAGLSSHPAVIKHLAFVGELLAEDTAGEGGEGAKFGLKDTPNQLVAKAMELQRQAMNEKNPAERRRLNQVAAELRAKGNPRVISSI